MEKLSVTLKISIILLLNMNMLTKHIVFAVIVLLLGVGSRLVAGTATPKKHASTGHNHHRRAEVFAVRPAVIDTAVIDTTDLVHQHVIKEINRWSSVHYKKGGVTLKGRRGRPLGALLCDALRGGAQGRRSRSRTE